MQSATDLSRDMMNEEASEESWQVQFSDGDTRTLTLEKLDDFYRLGIIDESTFVWQEGMEGWETLGSVLGIEPEASPVSAIAAAPAVVAPALLPHGGPAPLGSAPPPLRTSGPAPLGSAPPPVRTSGPAPLGSAPPPMRTSGPSSAAAGRPPELPEWAGPVSGINSRPSSGAPYVAASSQSGVQARTQVSVAPRAELLVAQTDSAWPPVSKSAAPVASSAPPGSVPVVSGTLPASLAPAVFTLPPAPMASSSGMGKGSVALLVGVALVFGGVALFRNDALDQSLLGGPAFGTPRAVDELVKQYADAYKTVEVPEHLLRKSSGQSTGHEEEASTDVSDSAPSGPSSKHRTRRSNAGSAPSGTSRSTGSAMNDPLKKSGAKHKSRAGDEYDPLNSNL